ncbi:MAG: hypothetical protein A2475_14755 [Ignavibacteria bacterium RIFOXYC2_FULL_35_21]|nr:MAG: hypothetical protein A2220_11620 [Ignavibacteria bacterium RIFOXYA2_FULL_35_10]OGV20136.1 MAG: hypothetical protein A2475_14755 [Ignavibacteria bacterium RIFOXYC2_FULL_35_21]
MKKIISISLFIFLFFCYIKAQGPNLINVTYMDNPYPGYMFLDPSLPGNFYLVDNAGVPIYNKHLGSNFAITNLNLQSDGNISLFWVTKFYTFDKNFELIDSFSCVGDYNVDFHDFIILPDGRIILLGNETRTMDLSQTVTGGQKEAIVIGSIIQELDKYKNLIFQWNSLDHFKITDVVQDEELTQPLIVSCHMNSIDIDIDGNILASSRVLDEITKINSKTGEIIWRLGGKKCKNNQFVFLNDTIDGFYGFSHQHSVTLLPNGNILIFDNGNLKPNPYSRAVEYKLDETNKTIEKVWEYSPFPEIYSQVMGNVQRLPNGNTLIGWGGNSSQLIATELKPDGSKALEINGYLNYAVYKYIFLMHAVTLDVDKKGIYDFNKDTNITDVKILINNFVGDGNISVAKHFYQPHNLEFPPPSQLEVGKTRWVVSKNGINDLDATIRFYVSYDTTDNVNDYFIFCREYEGKGSFSQLETRYNNIEKCLEAEIKGSGEFIIGIIPSVLAPIALYPLDSANDVEVNSAIMWQTMSISSEFRFQLSHYPDFSVLLIDSSNITNTRLDLNFEYNTTYYWHVRAFNEDEQSQWSKTFMFTTRPRVILTWSSLLYPPDKDSSVPVTGKLEWEEVKGALFYNVDVALDPDFTIPVLKRFNIDTNQLNYNSLLPERPHYWRVSSSNSYQVSDWSPVWMFVTEPALEVINRVDNYKIEIKQSNNKLILKYNDNFSGQFVLGIYDLRGYKIIDANGYVNDLKNNTIELDISSLYSGYYFFRIIIEDKIECGKILVD